MIILAVTIMQFVIRFMRIATSELLSDVSPIFRNVHIGTIIASILGIDPGSNGMVAISLGVVRRSQPIDGLLGIDAGVSLFDVRGEAGSLRLLSDDLHVFYDYRCSVVTLPIIFERFLQEQ